jgi:hypothetical protein
VQAGAAGAAAALAGEAGEAGVAAEEGEPKAKGACCRYVRVLAAALLVNRLELPVLVVQGRCCV